MQPELKKKFCELCSTTEFYYEFRLFSWSPLRYLKAILFLPTYYKNFGTTTAFSENKPFSYLEVVDT